jgi:hypothetical protein
MDTSHISDGKMWELINTIQEGLKDCQRVKVYFKDSKMAGAMTIEQPQTIHGCDALIIREPKTYYPTENEPEIRIPFKKMKEITHHGHGSALFKCPGVEIELRGVR